MVSKALLTGFVSVAVIAFLTFLGGMTEDIFAKTATIMNDVSTGNISKTYEEPITDSDIRELNRLTENMKKDVDPLGEIFNP